MNSNSRNKKWKDEQQAREKMSIRIQNKSLISSTSLKHECVFLDTLKPKSYPVPTSNLDCHEHRFG